MKVLEKVADEMHKARARSGAAREIDVSGVAAAAAARAPERPRGQQKKLIEELAKHDPADLRHRLFNPLASPNSG